MQLTRFLDPHHQLVPVLYLRVEQMVKLWPKKEQTTKFKFTKFHIFIILPETIDAV